MPGYLSLTLRDGFDRETVKRIEFQDKLLLENYVLNANGLMTDLAAITDLQIVRAAMVLTDGLSLPVTDPTGSNVDVGGTFVGQVEAGDGKKAAHKVPGIKMDLVGPGGVIDVADEDVAAYLTHFETDGDNDFYLSDGETIEEWLIGTLDK